MDKCPVFIDGNVAQRRSDSIFDPSEHFGINDEATVSGASGKYRPLTVAGDEHQFTFGHIAHPACINVNALGVGITMVFIDVVIGSKLISSEGNRAAVPELTMERGLLENVVGFLGFYDCEWYGVVATM